MIDPKFYEDRMKGIQRKIWVFEFIVAISVLSIFGLLFSTKYDVFDVFVVGVSCFILVVIATFSGVVILCLNIDYNFESDRFLNAISALGLSYDEYYCRGKTLKPSKEFRKLKR